MRASDVGDGRIGLDQGSTSVHGAHWSMLHRDSIAPWWMGDIDLDPFDPNHVMIAARRG